MNRNSNDGTSKYPKRDSSDLTAQNPQKMKMLYKKQINSHRATSTNAMQQANPQQNMNTQRTQAQQQFSPLRNVGATQAMSKNLQNTFQ